MIVHLYTYLQLLLRVVTGIQRNQVNSEAEPLTLRYLVAVPEITSICTIPCGLSAHPRRQLVGKMTIDDRLHVKEVIFQIPYVSGC